MTNCAVVGIRITKVPAGEAPLNIRQAWLGLVIPCHANFGMGNNQRGVLSGTPLKINHFAFSVLQDKALAALEAYNPSAATWWREHGFPKPYKVFCFDSTEAEFVGNPPPEITIIYNDLETGHWEPLYDNPR